MLTLTHEAPAVNPIPAEVRTADRLAWHNDADGNDWFDAYPGPGWQDVEGPAYVPTDKEEVQEAGYQIGLEGACPSFADAFPRRRADALDLGLAFTTGRNRGLREHARRLGHELGLGGLGKDRPASVAPRFYGWFVLGWEAGYAEWVERQEILKEYFAQLDAEQDAWEEEQENRARMGWPTPAAWCPALQA